MKISTIVFLVGLIGILISGSILLSNSHERLEDSQKSVQEATTDYDKIINKDIVFCMENNHSQCSEVMQEWYALCQQDDHKDIPSCEDGRLENYLKTHNIEEIPKDKYDFSIEGREFSSTGKNLLDSCERTTRYLSDAIVEYGLDSPETLAVAERNKLCIKSVDELRNTCQQLRVSGTIYPIVCDDAKLN